MQINISKEEYTTLLDILEIAHWVLFAHKTDEPEDLKRYQDFEQKIFSSAETIGYGNLIEYAKEYDRFFPTREQEENSSARPLIDEFEEDNFWEELIDRMANRDMLREIGEKKLFSMDIKERLKTYLDFEEKYSLEFEEHGIERLQIKD